MPRTAGVCYEPVIINKKIINGTEGVVSILFCVTIFNACKPRPRLYIYIYLVIRSCPTVRVFNTLDLESFVASVFVSIS